MSISGADVRHMASLARVGIADARIPRLVSELNGILSHMEALQSDELPPDLADSSAPAHGPSQMPLADDVRGSVALERTREQFAPATRDGFFLVPRLSTHGTAGALVPTEVKEDATSTRNIELIDEEVGE